MGERACEQLMSGGQSEMKELKMRELELEEAATLL